MRLESQVWRRYCQTFSTGLSSGAREGSQIGVMFSGMTRLGVVCQPARSKRSTACAPTATLRLISSRWSLHRLAVGKRQRQRRALALGRADGAEEIGALVALVCGLSRPRSSPRPLPHKAVLLTDARLVLKPDFDRRLGCKLRQMGVQDIAKVFLNASTIRASCLGWRGLALMCEKPSFLSSLPT